MFSYKVSQPTYCLKNGYKGEYIFMDLGKLIDPRSKRVSLDKLEAY